MAQTADEQRIWELHRGFVDANRVADSRFLRDHMAPDLIWYNLNQANYIGVDHIVELWDMLRKALGGKKADIDVWDERVTVSGDLAAVSYMLTLKVDLGGDIDFPDRGRTTEVWQRVGGEWKMLHFHCSSHVAGVMGGK